MKFKTAHLLITAFIIFWIIFLGWGMFKTGFKLFKEKTPTSQVSKKAQQPAITEQGERPKESIPEPAPAQTEPLPIQVRTLKVEPKDFRDVLPVMGSVKGKTEIELRFEINGVIKNINFREGEKIKQGDLIACLDPKDSQLKLSYLQNKLNSFEQLIMSCKNA